MAIPPQLRHQMTLKPLLRPLLALNFALYAVILGFAGWAYDKQMSGRLGGNKVTSDLITYTLLAGVVGIASVLAGLYYLRRWNSESRASAMATSILAVPVTILALGVASKYIHVGGLHNKKLTTLAAYAIISAITQLLYTLLVHGIFGHDKLIGHTAPAAPAAPAAAGETTATKEATAPPEAPPHTSAEAAV
ncbi:hypothetical protein SELMODRAFT_447317 [Selaginella moellendorffii]|uniref:Uncharacterized protein n=1 Tax=Selaginella moellendorffii TaxID=88036 RepID=D8SYG6_SELML|nr:membrane protein PM19L [Selaginella moellendorffii]EFJ10517.1 hypothetical protein SELMODRAFT_447317 [Selaginella moellendorffii]|eukprot:XP_002988427.1 membrane protein PM19L [Selaginella moellendorffii]